MRITKTMTFDAAHFLPDIEGTPPADRRYERMHGHSFAVRVSIEGEPGAQTGWVADFDKVSDALKNVYDILDHNLLNEIEGLERPTLENICLWIANKLGPVLPGLCEVEVSRPSIGESCLHECR